MNFLSLSLCPVMFLVIGKCDTNSWSKLKLMISLLKTNFFFFLVAQTGRSAYSLQSTGIMRRCVYSGLCVCWEGGC